MALSAHWEQKVMDGIKDMKGIRGLHPDANLNYTFPSKEYRIIPEEVYLPKDFSLTYCSGIDLQPEPTPAFYSKTPISKKFPQDEKVKRLSDPIDAILAKSRKDIENYQFTLPYDNLDREAGEDVKESDAALLRGKKRARDSNEVTEEHMLTNDRWKRLPPYNPESVKMISQEVQGDGNALQQSTPVASPKEGSFRRISETRTPDTNKFLRLDLARYEITKDAGSEYKVTLGKKLLKKDKETPDNLACHAGNILKMAVDSTMLGSSFSDSFSTVTNILGDNDSVQGSSKKFHIFEDPEESDVSVLGFSKSRPKLNKRRAQRVDVSAKDLQAAVQADEKLPTAP